LNLSTNKAIVPNSSRNYSQIAFGKTDFDSFEKTKISPNQATVENSIESFAEKLYEQFDNNTFSTENLRNLIKEFSPRTKLKHEKNNHFSALHISNQHFSKHKNKFYYGKDKILVNTDKFENKKSTLFIDIIHEMIHHLQKNENETSYINILNDYINSDPEQKLDKDTLIQITNGGCFLVVNTVENYYSLRGKTLQQELNTELIKALKDIKTDDKQTCGKLLLKMALLATKTEIEAYDVSTKITKKYFPQYNTKHDDILKETYEKLSHNIENLLKELSKQDRKR